MSTVPNESRIPIGTILVGKYKVSREIGRGGMAAVYEAEHLALSKKVAIKVLAAELTNSRVVSERFFREARAAASVKSPHIVDVYDSGRLEDGRPFIVMELLEGESLYDRMARIRILDFPTTIKIINDCAKGLTKAHAIGIVHRDLKPENIFILRGEDGVEYSKVLDFGLAKFYAPVDEGEKTARLTREGAVFGTPAYMSPEQVKGQGTVDHRSDLWALGCLAYECLTGRPVWNTEQGVAMTFAAIATEALPIPSQVYPGIPTTFDDWFRKSLERKPENRFQSAKELADALAIALGARASSNDLRIDAGTTGGVRAVVDPSGRLPPDSARSGNIPESSPSGRLDGQGNRLDATGSNRSLQASASMPSGSSLVGQINNGNSSMPDGSGAYPHQQEGFATGSYIAPRPSTLRYAVGGLLMVASFAGAAVAWVRSLGPQVMVPMVEAQPLASETASERVRPLPVREEVRWVKILAEGQRLFAAGDLGGAQKKFREAQDAGGGASAKSVFDQSKAAGEGRGVCRVAALAHPRTGVTDNAGRPTVLLQPKGALVVWTDDHELSGREHAYSVMIDEAGVATTPMRDLTPEGTNILRPVLLQAGDRSALFYWDKAGKDAGVRARLLDAEGRIEGESQLLSPARGSFWPSVTATPSGFAVVWSDDRDGSEDLFYRKLSSRVEPDGKEVRLTDYWTAKGHTVAVKLPAVAVAANSLLVAYRLERDAMHSIQALKVSLSAPELDKGLEEHGEAPARADKVIGETRSVSDDKGDAPTVACGSEGCFVAWHGEPSGAFVARIEPLTGKRLWYKQLVKTGGRPALAVGSQGEVVVSFYEQNRVKLATLSREGVSTPSVFARALGDPPRPYVAPGKAKGEWYVGWLDQEGGHLEPYVARVVCAR